jgi:hypothetical protein
MWISGFNRTHDLCVKGPDLAAKVIDQTHTGLATCLFQEIIKILFIGSHDFLDTLNGGIPRRFR